MQVDIDDSSNRRRQMASIYFLPLTTHAGEAKKLASLVLPAAEILLIGFIFFFCYLPVKAPQPCCESFSTPPPAPEGVVHGFIDNRTGKSIQSRKTKPTNRISHSFGKSDE